jgi:hypothetical protein
LKKKEKAAFLLEKTPFFMLKIGFFCGVSLGVFFAAFRP